MCQPVVKQARVYVTVQKRYLHENYHQKLRDTTLCQLVARLSSQHTQPSVPARTDRLEYLTEQTHEASTM